MPEVTFPYMRRELQYAVRALADDSFQMRVWGRHQLPNERYSYSFEMALHTLLDDSGLENSREELIGVILVSDSEFSVLSDLVAVALAAIADIGLKGTYNDAQGRTSWRRVIEFAARATAVLGYSGEFP